MDNYYFINNLPEGWHQLARQMIKECEELDPTYTVTYMKEKWGRMDVFSTCKIDAIRDIEDAYEIQSANTCVVCGKPAMWLSRDWIYPFCNSCIEGPIKNYTKINESFI